MQVKTLFFLILMQNCSRHFQSKGGNFFREWENQTLASVKEDVNLVKR